MESFPQTDRARWTPISALIFCVITGILFFPALPYGSQYVWYEALFCVLIFLMAIVTLLAKGKYFLETRYKHLIFPLLILGAYSVFQGLAGLVLPQYTTRSFASPYAYDTYNSLWSGIKVISIVVYFGLLGYFFKRNLKPLLWAVVISGNFIALLGLFRYIVQVISPKSFTYFILPSLKPGIGFGPFINQNHFAFLMLMVLGLNICLFVSHNISKANRVLFLSATVTTWAAIVLTGSRAGIVGSFVVVAVAISQLARQYSIGRTKWTSLGAKIAIFCFFAAILALGIILIGQDRVIHRFRQLPAQFEEPVVKPGFMRMDIYPAAIEMFADNPIFGVGFGSFQYANTEYIDISGIEVPKQAHNDYLEFAASGGLISLVLGGWFLFGLFKTTRNGNPSTGVGAAARSGAICGIAGIAFHSFFDFGIQIFSNLIFVTAFLYLMTHKEPGSGKLFDQSPRRLGSFTFTILAVTLCVLLSLISILIGFARYQQYYSGSASHPSVTGLLLLPFDAESYIAESRFEKKRGNVIGAILKLNSAIKYRPRDYKLWLELGGLQKDEELFNDAMFSFQKSSELAPEFSLPKYELGLLFYKVNKKTEAFAALRFAYRRNPRHFLKTVELAWEDSNNSTKELIQKLSPLTTAESVMLGLYFYDRNMFPALVELTCDNESANDSFINSFVIRLIEKRRYRLAYSLLNKQCESKPPVLKFIDGGFENGDITEGIGFGWRTGVLPSTIETKIVRNNSDSGGGSSLKIEFKGESNNELRIIYQLVVLEPNTEYRVSFKSGTKNLVTSGRPIVNFITHGPETDGMSEAVELDSGNSSMKSSSVTIRTDGVVEALEVQLVRNPCLQRTCPVYGSILLDDFKIVKINKIKN